MTVDIAVPMDEPNSLALWAQGAREVNALAEHLASSALVPQTYRGKPVDLLACWLTGQELGIAPMAALRSIDVIQGTPSLRAHAMRALVLSRGHAVEIVEADGQHCIMRGRRKGSDAWQTVTWDLARAKALGLLGKDQWTKQPQTMLIARATGEICRLIAADVLYAVPYASEEIRDNDVPVQATAAVERPRPAKLADIIAPAEPEPVDIGDAAEAMTQAQGRKLYALLKKTGREDRDAGLTRIGEILGGGRIVESTKELSKAEAILVIDALEAEEKQPAQPPAAERDPWDVAVDAEQPELS